MVLKAVLFDLDDTLIDWSKLSVDWRAKDLRHVDAVFRFVHEHGAALNVPVEVIQENFSRRTRDAWSVARATLRAPHFGQLLMDTLDHFGLTRSEALSMAACLNAHGWGAIEGVYVFPDVPPALEELRQHGIEIGIVTNSHQPATMRDHELRDYDLLKHFPQVHTRITAADVGYLKPHPFIFNHALKAIGATAEETVFVGDNIVADVSGAQKVGMKAVLRVNAEEPPLSSMIEPDAKIKNLGELLNVLDGWYEGWR